MTGLESGDGRAECSRCRKAFGEEEWKPLSWAFRVRVRSGSLHRPGCRRAVHGAFAVVLRLLSGAAAVPIVSWVRSGG